MSGHRCSGCYQNFRGDWWCDNCDAWPCTCPDSDEPGETVEVVEAGTDRVVAVVDARGRADDLMTALRKDAVDARADEITARTEVYALRAQVAELTAALRIALHDLHPVYGSTAGPGGGIGGQAVTPFCHVINPRSMADDVLTTTVLHEVLVDGVRTAGDMVEPMARVIYDKVRAVERDCIARSRKDRTPVTDNPGNPDNEESTR